MEVRKYNRRGYICMIILIVLLIPFFVPRVVGLQTFSVISGSMEPVIPTGSLIYVKEVSVDDVKKNDVISFYGKQGSIVTHRIQQIDSDGIVTKGDANEDIDLMKVRGSQLIGKVLFSIPLLGYLTQSLWLYVIALFLLGASIVFWWKAHQIEKSTSRN